MLSKAEPSGKGNLRAGKGPGQNNDGCWENTGGTRQLFEGRTHGCTSNVWTWDEHGTTRTQASENRGRGVKGVTEGAKLGIAAEFEISSPPFSQATSARPAMCAACSASGAAMSRRGRSSSSRALPWQWYADTEWLNLLKWTARWTANSRNVLGADEWSAMPIAQGRTLAGLG